MSASLCKTFCQVIFLGLPVLVDLPCTLTVKSPMPSLPKTTLNVVNLVDSFQASIILERRNAKCTFTYYFSHFLGGIYCVGASSQWFLSPKCLPLKKTLKPLWALKSLTSCYENNMWIVLAVQVLISGVFVISVPLFCTQCKMKYLVMMAKVANKIGYNAGPNHTSCVQLCLALLKTSHILSSRAYLSIDFGAAYAVKMSI